MKPLLCHVSICLCLCSALWAQPSPKELTVLLPGDVPLEMVWIEPGTFMMGTTEAQKSVMAGLRAGEGPTSGINRYSNTELPAHQVTISKGFYLGKFEVTQAHWKAVMGVVRGGVGTDNPVTQVSWITVQNFIDKLNEVTGTPLYRLPTAAEWEYACRGGTETLWFTGDDPDGVEEYINYGELTGKLPVGSLRPNPWGLYDMSGNVEEWVLDDVRRYTAIPQVDPIGPTPQNGDMRAGTRGASAGHAAFPPKQLLWFSRCAFRYPDGRPIDAKANSTGFRVLRRDAPSTSVEESSWGGVKSGQEKQSLLRNGSS